MVSLQGDNGIEIKITTKVDDKELKKFMPQMRRLAEEQRQLSELMGKPIKSVAFGGKEIATAFKNANKEVRSFKMQYLGIMFAGMALQRTFGGVLTSAFQVYNKVTEGTNQAGGAITRLNAAWTFFKFSLIDALQASPFFSMLIEWGIKFVDYLSTISDDAAYFLVTVTAIGGLLAVGGQIMLGVTSLRTALSEAAGEAVSLKDTMAKIGGTIAIAFAFKEAADAYDAFKDKKVVDAILGSISSLGFAIGGIKAIKGAKGAGWFIAIGVLFSVLSDNKMLRDVSALISQLAGLFIGGGAWIGAQMGKAIINGVIDAITANLLRIAAVISGLPGMGGLYKQINAGIKELKKIATAPLDVSFEDYYVDVVKRADDVLTPVVDKIISLKDAGDAAIAAKSNSDNNIIIINNNGGPQAVPVSGVPPADYVRQQLSRAGVSQYSGTSYGEYLSTVYG